MNVRIYLASPLRRATTVVLAAAGLTLSLGSTPLAAQTLPCSWPIETTGTGSTNVAYPDTSATYWVMTVDTTMWPTMMLRGQYPESRFFSFVSYLDNGSTVDSIIDSTIAPDPGSLNPFVPGGQASGSGTYRVTVSRDTTVAGNRIVWGDSQTGHVIYRVYVPDKGLGRTAGVPLPTITLVGADGNPQLLSPCQSDAISALANGPVSSLLSGTCPPPSDPLALLNHRERVLFARVPHGHTFGNPANNYIEAPLLCLEPNKVIVVRAKAPVFPDTYNGGSIFQPAIPGTIQVRYWSMCNNNEVSPFPVVGCQPDWATKLDNDGFFTYVVSPDESGVNPPAPPAWLPPDATWLPWGDPSRPNVLIYRNMLPANFSLTGDYYPRGVFCDKQLFIGLGWRACFAAVGAFEE